MSYTGRSIFRRALIGLTIPVILGGCAFSAPYPVHTFESSVGYEEKEEVKIPIEPENLEWIFKTCPSHRVVTSRKYREITPYGVVFRKIQCVPVDEARDMPPIGESGLAVEYSPTIGIEDLQELRSWHPSETGCPDGK